MGLGLFAVLAGAPGASAPASPQPPARPPLATLALPDLDIEVIQSIGVDADAIAGGKLLLSKRLKMVIKYHQVIPA